MKNEGSRKDGFISIMICENMFHIKLNLITTFKKKIDGCVETFPILTDLNHNPLK